jgi:hypothetical protein
MVGNRAFNYTSEYNLSALGSCPGGRIGVIDGYSNAVLGTNAITVRTEWHNCTPTFTLNGQTVTLQQLVNSL